MIIITFLYHLARAPVYIEWEKEKEPHLEIRGINEQSMGFGAEAYQVIVFNSGKDDARKCHGRLIDVKFENPEHSLDKIRVNNGSHWIGQVENAEYFDIPGSQPASLNIVYGYRVPINKEPSVQFAYRSTAEVREEHALPINFGTILILVRLSYRDYIWYHSREQINYHISSRISIKRRRGSISK